MKSRTSKILIGSLLLSVLLLACVPVCNILLSFCFDSDQKNGISNEQLFAGILSETIRAFISCYLYANTENKGSSFLHSIKFGFLYSALIGSLYLILGYWYFQLKSPSHFLVGDSFILAIQGVVSGILLYYVFRSRSHNVNEK